MICESISFNSYKSENLTTLDRTTEKTENSSNVKKNNHKNGKNDKIMKKNNHKLMNIYNPMVKNNQKNENKNNSSYNITKRVINNYLFITKNVFLFRDLNIKREFLTEILIGLKKDEKINLPCYSSNIFKYQNYSEINERHRIVVIDDLIYVSKNIYTQNDIIAMEKDILSTLNFDIFFVSSYQFFSFFYLVCDFNNKILFCLGHLILELCLLNIDIMSCEQSLLAIGALLIAKKSLDINEEISNIKSIYNYNENDIKEIQKKIVLFLNKIVYSNKNCLILEKFEKKKYLSVSYIFKCDNKCNMCNNICYKKNISCK